MEARACRMTRRQSTSNLEFDIYKFYHDSHQCVRYCLIDNHQSKGATVSRLQLALNVSDLDEAVAFYTSFFKTEPAKIRPGYANFRDRRTAAQIVLFENPGIGGNH